MREKTSVVFLLVVCLAFAPLAHAQAHGKQIRQVNKFVRSMKKLWEWGSWVGRASVAVEADKPLPPPPVDMAGKSEILATLEQQLQDARDIEVAKPVLAIPPVPHVPSTSFDAIRGSLQPATSRFGYVMGELEEIEAFRATLQDSEEQIKQEFSVMGQVEQVLIDAAMTVPHPKLQEKFLFAVVDINLVFVPELTKVEDTIIAKRRDAKNEVVARAQAMKSTATELRNLLLVEKTALSAEAQRLAAAASALRKRLDALEQRRVAIEYEETAIQNIEVRIQDQAQQIARLDGSIQNAVSNRNFSIEARRKFIEDQRTNYHACPAGTNVTYADCTHTNLKDQFDARSATLQYAVERQREVDYYNSYIPQLQQQRQQLVNDNNRLRNEIAARRTTVQQKRTQYQADLVVYRADLQKDLEDRWKSRANIHDAANQTDLAQIDAVLTRLAALEAL